MHVRETENLLLRKLSNNTSILKYLKISYQIPDAGEYTQDVTTCVKQEYMCMSTFACT